MNWNDFVQRVPPDVLAHIYEYDDTYRVTAYRRVVAEFHENQWIAWKRSNHYICRDIVSYRNVLNYVLSETESIDAFEPNINVYAALYDSRVRRLLWHHDPFSTDAYFMYLPNIFFDPSHPEETEQASFVMRIGDEYRMEGTIMSERCHQSVWQHDREYPSPRIQDSITVYQDEMYRILLHL
jgi:hypothetical protein